MFRVFIIYLLFLISVVPMYSQTKRYDFVFEDCNLKVDLPTNYKVKHSPNKSAKITIPDIGKVYIYAEIPKISSLFIQEFLHDDIDTASIKDFVDLELPPFTNPKKTNQEYKRRLKISQSFVDTFIVYHTIYKTKGLLYKNYNISKTNTQGLLHKNYQPQVTKEKYYYRIILDTRYGLEISSVNYVFVDFYTNKKLSKSELDTYINSWIKNVELTHYKVLIEKEEKKIVHDGRKPFEDGYTAWKQQKIKDSIAQIEEEKQKRRFGGDTLGIGGFQDGYYIAFKTKDSLLFKHHVYADSSNFYLEIYYYNIADLSPFSTNDYIDINDTTRKRTGKINIYYYMIPGGTMDINITPSSLYNSFEKYVEEHTKWAMKWAMNNYDIKNAVYYSTFKPNIKSSKDVVYVYKSNKNTFIYLYFFQLKDKYLCLFTIKDNTFKDKDIFEFIIKNLDIIPKNK